MRVMKQTFKINNYISLKLLKNNNTVIYRNNKRFRQCAYLLLHIEKDLAKNYENIHSIDEFSEVLDSPPHSISEDLDPITEFWGHCSNLQAWVENNYDTRLLHTNLAFPLLKELKRLGDPIAEKVYKEEIISRISCGYLPVITYLIEQGYFSDFSTEELKNLFSEHSLLKNILSSLTKYRNEYWYDNTINLTISQLFHNVDLKSFIEAYNDLTSEDKALIKTPLKCFFSKKENLSNIHQDLLNFLKNEVLSSKFQPITYKNKEFAIEEGMLFIVDKNIKDIRDLQGLENNLEIEVLTLGQNSISEIEGLQSLKNLRVLELGGNKISKISNLDNLPRLEKLILRDNIISKIEGLSSLKNLRELLLRKNKIEEINGLENLSKLDYLDVSNNRILEIKGLERLRNLGVLILNNNLISEITGLESLRNLGILELHNNQISEVKGLENLLNLTCLDLSNNPITEIKGLENLLNLKDLKIDSTHIDPKLLKRLRYSKGKFQDAQLLVEYCRFKKNLKLRFDIQKILDLEGGDYFCSLCKKEHLKGDLFKQHISYTTKK